MTAANLGDTRTTTARDPFVRIAIAVGVLTAVLLGTAATRAVRHSGKSRAQGWSEVRTADGWLVAEVDPRGPAAAALRPGDRVTAVNGDPRVAQLGSRWVTHAIEPGEPYAIEVRRGSQLISLTLEIELRRDSYLVWVLLYLAIAASYFVVAMVMAIAKPESRTVRYGFASCLVMAGFMVWLASRPVHGVQRDVLTSLLGLTFPFSLIAGLLFMDRFPHAVRAAAGWRVAMRAVAALGIALWAPRAWATVLRLLPAQPAALALDASLPLVSAYVAAGPIAESAYAGGVVALIFVVLLRNYRLLDGPGERRRIQLVLWSHALAFVPLALVALGGAVSQLLGLSGRDSASLLFLTQAANALLILTPASFGYALVKHRVLGVRVFIRIGIQYVLARNVLRAASALPAVALVYVIVSNPSRTVGEILFSGSSAGPLLLLALAGAGLRFRAPLAASIDRRFFRTAYDQEKILLRLMDSVKQLDSLAEIVAMVGREIDAALHVRRVSMFFRSARARNLQRTYASDADGVAPELPFDSPLLATFAREPAARARSEIDLDCAPADRAFLDRHQVDLVVPVTGIDHDIFGLMLLGEKRSEEPYTSKDRELLQMLATQIGAVYEILALREEVGQQQQIQSEVLSRLDRSQINVVKECPACGLCADSDVERCPDDGQRLVPSLPVDRTLDGKYRLERLMGRGGMGAVYEASDLQLQRRVAVKLVRSSALSRGDAQRRFAREARACGRLEHANIVRVYDFGLSGETAYLVMEYVRGVTWRAELDRVGTLSTNQAAVLLEQVLDGMEAAHRAGVLHRDLKPANLLICAVGADERPTVKILDFGLAKVREADFVDPKSQTRAGQAMGTLGYMSPEQLYGEAVDERTDVYAIGVITLETLTGQLPVEGPSFHERIDAELVRRLLAPALTAPQRRLAFAIQRALARRVDDRYASISELRAAIVPALAECPELPAPSGSSKPVVSVDSAAPTRSPTAAADPTQSKLSWRGARRPR